MAPDGDGLAGHAVVSRDEWLAARAALLAKEKAFTRLRDELSRERRALPWVRVDTAYVFDTPEGKKTLAELFDGTNQLVVYHFMFSPEWDAGCPSCSFWADSFDGVDVHLRQRDVTFLAVSRAPLAKIAAFKRRMGWRFRWVSSFGSPFNYDFQVSFPPARVRGSTVVYNYAVTEFGGEDREGISAFVRDERGAVFHTYSSYARGVDMINVAYQLLDLAPKGRAEEWFEAPQDWVRHHDRYAD